MAAGSAVAITSSAAAVIQKNFIEFQDMLKYSKVAPGSFSCGMILCLLVQFSAIVCASPATCCSHGAVREKEQQRSPPAGNGPVLAGKWPAGPLKLSAAVCGECAYCWI